MGKHKRNRKHADAEFETGLKGRSGRVVVAAILM